MVVQMSESRKIDNVYTTKLIGLMFLFGIYMCCSVALYLLTNIATAIIGSLTIFIGLLVGCLWIAKG